MSSRLHNVWISPRGLRRATAASVGALAFAMTAGSASAAVCNVPDASHRTIQSAADDTRCTEIVLDDQIYTEQVTIGRAGGIVLRGAGAGRTVISSPSRRTGSRYSTSFLSGFSYVIQVKPGTSATIKDLSIDGRGNATCAERYFGIRFVNASGTVDSVLVDNVRARGAEFACPNKIGIAATADRGSTSAVTIARSTVRRFEQTGILANGADATLTISDTVVRGVGPQSLIAQQGVRFASGAAGKVERGDISDLNFTGDPCKGTGAGISVEKAGAVTLSDSFIHAVDRGILLSENTTDKVVASKNRIVETLSGIAAKKNGSGKVELSGNGISGTTRSTARTVATCFDESGDGIALEGETGSVVSGNQIAGSGKSAIELRTGTGSLEVSKNGAVRSTGSDIEDKGTGNRLSMNLCLTSTPAGLCSGNP